MNFKEFLIETKPGRAWNGRLEKIDELLRWMYDKDILTKGEKSKKDMLFNQYYRYYNDGDMPRNLSNEHGPIRKWHDDDVIANALETKLEDFIKGILSKYTGKIDKGMFHIDTQLDKVNTLISVVDRNDIHGLTKYWIKNTKDDKIISLTKELEKKYDELNNLTKVANSSYEWKNSYDNPQNTMMVHRKEKMKEVKIWSSDMETRWKDIQRGMFDVSELLSNIKTSLEKMKKIKMFDKE